MTAAPLARLLERSPDLRAALAGLLPRLGPRAGLRDANGNLLLGADAEPGPDDAPVAAEGETIGWVTGADDAAAGRQAAALVALFARQEAEKRALGAEVIERYREVNLFYNLSERLAAAPHPPAILAAALDEALRLNKAGAGLYLALDGTEPTPRVAAARGVEYGEACLGPLFARVLAGGKADIENDAPAPAYFPAAAEARLWLACAPVTAEKQVQGLLVLVRAAGPPFSAGALKLLNSIAMQIAPALEIIRLYQVAVDNERMERELLMARQVQQSLLPAEMPRLAGWEFARLWRPAREVSGDFYDLIDEGPDRLGLVIGDVTDKGMPAALFMVFARSALRAAVRQELSPAGAASAANDLICRDSFEGLFATLVYARLDPQNGRLVYVNGGHNPPLFYRACTDEIVPLARTGLPLGVMEDSPYAEEELQLEPGDFLLFYTDGITEAVDASQAEFGAERLLCAARGLRALPPGELVAGLEQALTAFADPAQSFDDITMLVVRRSPPSV